MRSLFGYGLTTKAIAKSGGWSIYDDKFKSMAKDDFGNSLLPPSEFDAQKSELEIPSPGFPRTHRLAKEAKNLISEYDFFRNTSPTKVWISGTNGKTTTTQMSQFLLKNFGSVMGGNVGTPLAALDKNAKIWILETSSFTIHYTKFAYPKIYALLPVTPDHLSWHGDMSEYVKAKLKPLSMMDSTCTAIVPKIYANTPSRARILSYENDADLAKICGIDIDNVKFKIPFLMDALMALCVQKLLVGEADVALLNEFEIEKNRIEEFHDRFSRLWVNDTKATNLDATIQAVRRYKELKIRLILGGDDKGVDLHELFDSFLGLDLEIYAIGSNTDKLMALANQYGFKATRCEVLETAVNKIALNLANSGEVALLSPACASLDQFSSYAQRGDKFKEFVANL
ncbi:UDP-N-acetylmuramoyl-L-alanine--D-glutamate ligase [Campylobacter geochelonis]|uniref:UDP-N-acetylmuramoyl-L-alanyl-D-glutamate synthetase n=1 Tax=Campylobacter geochelonis TaxID=1780362 RepID=A0A128EFX5_9BACT|nr:UDP-N-acetylmuramoyl-L-alanine--D-glutamate ligase [Campylobacter geochelonis]QKF71917.1 UDP-N-acetylmuramoyl-L-alanine:D-glutamate ligase [Campylobacter geochelonis]CZE47148.1 UDP-N-acetylmuramoyl-L-alanyl-D-glutamate synthetase [Campylobacter geochelonis]CZE47876.1 UDP-N-acetylmuramoyl-L-alanyl-D-glutamate synthetase [Campylobacter geochelonis]CZE49987.1 UDP-N-acetylmuramoyl-L-alanyl-D-glutamate synthetase [Campylobacter geochelonis]